MDKQKSVLPFLFFLLVLFTPNLQAQQGGYCWPLYVTPGETLNVYISTSSSPFALSIYKLGTQRTLVTTYTGLTGGARSVPSNAYANGCNWPVTKRIVIPATWTSGVYNAEFPITGGTKGFRFVVGEATRGSFSSVAVCVNVNTMAAYNEFGGKSLYDYNSSGGVRSSKVSFLRPFPYHSLDLFESWEEKFIGWLGRESIPVEYLTNIELHRNPSFLDPYSVLILVGHDEYWSLPQRRQVERFLHRGGRLAIFSGNTCWWQVRFEDNGKKMVCYKSSADPFTGVADSLVTTNWFYPPVNFPENSLIGVSFRNAGYVAHGSVLPKTSGYGDFAVYDADHWVYRGTGLKDGDEFGYANDIVGYETDGALFNWVNGIPTPLGSDGSPLNFRILGLSPAGSSTGLTIGRHATMGMYHAPGNGVVFNASTIDWVHGLATDSNVSKITRNVIRRFTTNLFPPEIESWEPFAVMADSNNREVVYRNSRKLTVGIDSTLRFVVRATDPRNEPLLYFWTVNGVEQSVDSVFLFTPTMANLPASVQAYVFNSHDTASISWQLSSPIISDEFNSGTLGSFWTPVNPRNDAQFLLTPAQLSIAVPAGQSHDAWTGGIFAPRIMQHIPDKNFHIEFKCDGVLSLPYQAQGIIVEQDSLNYLRLDFLSKSSSQCRVYTAAIVNGVATTKINTTITNTRPLYMRIKRERSQWTQSYSTNGTSFITAGSFSLPLAVKRIGLFALNAGSPAPAYTALFDYFRSLSAPVILQHPAPLTVAQGETARFEVGVAGAPPLSYQWQKNGVNITGANVAVFISQPVTAGDSGAVYRCKITNSYGSIFSNAAVLSVLPSPPRFTLEPRNAVATHGGSATFSVAVAGTQPIGLQWQRDGVDISDATQTTFSLAPVSSSDSGAVFRCVATNAVGADTSDAAVLAALPNTDPSGILSDNFNSPALNSFLWSFVNPRNDAVLSMTGGGVAINIPSGMSHDAWTGGDFATRILQHSNNSDLQVEARFTSTLSVLTNQYAFEGIIVEQDSANYLRFDFVKSATALKLFSASVHNNIATQRSSITITGGNSLYLSVKRIGNLWMSSYSLDGLSWTSGANYSDSIVVSRTGLLFGTAGSAPPAFVGVADYFLNSAAPVSPTLTTSQLELPTVFRLEANYPNPFNPMTVIRYQLPVDAHVVLKVYDLLGKEVAVLLDENQAAGYKSTEWDAQYFPSGTYFLTIHAGEFHAVRKMLLVK